MHEKLKTNKQTHLIFTGHAGRKHEPVTMQLR